MLVGSERTTEYQGQMRFGNANIETHSGRHVITWNLVVTNQRRSKRNETIDGGKILFLHVMLDDETTARFNDGKWIKRPSLFRDKPSKEMVDYLLKVYN